MVAEGYKETEIGVIPEEWEVVKLKDIGQSIIGLTYSPSDVVDSNHNAHLVLRSSNVQNSNISLKDNVYVNKDIPEKLIVKQGDILICSRNGSKNLIGKNAYISQEYVGHTFGAFMTIYRSKYSHFVYQLLQTNLYQKQIDSNMGATINQITTGNLNSFKFPFPPLKEQEKIADILCSADEKIDAIASQIQKVETLKKGLLQKLLSEGIGHSEFKNSELGKIPESWEVVNIGSILELLTDYHANGSYEKLSENVSLLDKEDYSIMVRTTNFEKNNFKDNLIYIDEFAYNYLKKSKVYEHDIIINKIANAGATYLMPKIDKPVSLAMNLFLLRFKDDILKQYVYFQIKRNEDRLKLLASGTSTKTITKDDVRGFKILLAPLEEQKQIADILSTADEKLEVLRAKKEKYTTLKKGLLQKLLSGEVRV